MALPALSQKIGLLVERGLFESEDNLRLSAYRSLFTLRPELKTELALSLYERGEISLGRAAEMAGLSREEMKEILAARGIERRIALRSPEQVAEDVRFLLENR